MKGSWPEQGRQVLSHGLTSNSSFLRAARSLWREDNASQLPHGYSLTGQNLQTHTSQLLLQHCVIFPSPVHQMGVLKDKESVFDFGAT